MTNSHLSEVPKKKSLFKRWWFWLLIIILILVAYLYIDDRIQSQKHEEWVANLKSTQLEACEEEVASLAKYPGGVVFVDPPVESEYSPLDNGMMRFDPTGRVDFPNAWGTPVRYTYTCTVFLSEDGTKVERIYADAHP